MYKTTFKDFIENLYKKPINEIPKKEIKEHANEIFGLGISKDDLNDDGSDLETLQDILN